MSSSTAKATLARAAKEYKALWDKTDPAYGAPHIRRGAFRYFGILLGTSEKSAEEKWDAVAEEVVREYTAEKRPTSKTATKKVVVKRSVTQTTIERYCVRLPLHLPPKPDDIQMLEKRKRQAKMEEFFSKKPRH